MPPTKDIIHDSDDRDEPPDFLNFIYMRGFDKDWEELGFDEGDLLTLELKIMEKPDGAPVIKGTGGLRKLRFAKKGRGKRGSCRVCYAVFPEASTVVVYIAYAKNERADLSPADKRFISGMIKRERAALSSRRV